MLHVETEVGPTPPDEEEEGDDDYQSVRVGLDVMDVGDTHYTAATQLFGPNAEDPERGAEAMLRVALAAAQLRGPDHHWALMQRLVAFDGSTAT